MSSVNLCEDALCPLIDMFPYNPLKILQVHHMWHCALCTLRMLACTNVLVSSLMKSLISRLIGNPLYQHWRMFYTGVVNSDSGFPVNHDIPG